VPEPPAKKPVKLTEITLKAEKVKINNKQGFTMLTHLTIMAA